MMVVVGVVEGRVVLRRFVTKDTEGNVRGKRELKWGWTENRGVDVPLSSSSVILEVHRFRITRSRMTS